MAQFARPREAPAVQSPFESATQPVPSASDPFGIGPANPFAAGPTPWPAVDHSSNPFGTPGRFPGTSDYFGGNSLAPAAPAPGDAPPVPLPAAGGARSATVPVTVRTACVALWVAAGACAVLSGVGVYLLTELRGSVDKALHLDPTGTVAFYAAEYVDNAELTLISAAVMLGLLFAIAYVIVARAVRKGRSWPRMVGSVLAVFSLPAAFLGPAALTAVVAGFVSVLAVWTPSARRYAAEVKELRRA